MQTIFWIAVFLDLIILAICLYETFFVSSNRSYGKYVVLLSLLLFGGWWYYSSRPMLALTLVCAPAGIALLFALIMVLMFMFGGGRWQ